MTEPDYPPNADILGDVLPAPTPGRSRVRTGLVIAAAVGSIGVAGAGVVAAMYLSGGGAQPEDVLPKGAIAFVKLDLDPAASQKLNIYSLSKRFPDAAKELSSADALRDDALRLAFSDTVAGLDYDRDVKPWLGDRIGVAALPSGGDEPDVVVALAYTDRDRAEQALTKIKAESTDSLDYVFVDDYVLLSDDAAVVRRAAEAKEHLADDKAFKDGVAALDGDQVALAWTDVSRVWDALPDEMRTQASASPGSTGLNPTGQVVIGVQVEKNAVEITGKTVDVKTGIASQDALRPTTGTGLAADLPDEAIAALSFGGLGEALVTTYDDVVSSLKDLAPDIDAQAKEFGLDLPKDLETLLGTETAVAVWGDDQEPQVLVRTRSDSPGDALAVLKKAFAASGGSESGEEFDDYVKKVDRGIAAGTPAALAAAEAGGLGDREQFRRAVPDSDSAGLVMWVSLQQAFQVGDVHDPNLEPLEAIGVTASGGATGEFRIRLTFR